MSNFIQVCRNRSAWLLLIFSIVFFSGTYVNAATQLSQFGITWTFDGDYETGQFANGDHWVVGPVAIVNINPASTSGSRVMNGAMVNPSPTYGTRQGYDSAMYAQYGPNYSSDLNAALDVSNNNPLVLDPGSSLVSTISVGSAGNRPQIYTAAILTVLDAPAPEGSFRPQYCRGDKTIRFNKSQLNFNFLPKLPRVPNTPALSTIERKFERPWIDHAPTWLARYTHPSANMPDYGGDISTDISEGASMLMLDFTNQDIETLLIRYVQLGIDLHGIIQDGGQNNWSPNGGHASGRKWPIMFAGMMLGDYTMTNIGAGGMGNPFFGEDGQTFYVSQSDVNSGRYSSSDLGMPEWGIRHAADPSMDSKSWTTPYRQCCTANNWAGFVLAARIMGAINIWNHNALFDYMDRYMDIEPLGSYTRQMSKFNESMWDAYRADFGGIWPDSTFDDDGISDGTDTEPPLPPTDLISTSQTENSIALKWTAPGPASDGDTPVSYNVIRGNTLVANPSETSYTDKLLASGTTYNYKVFSVDDADNISTSAATGSFSTTAVTDDQIVTGTSMPLPEIPATSKTFYVSPAGSNTNDGTSWQKAFRSLPSTLQRDATYYIAGGNYPAYTFDDPASTQPIVIKKATSDDHGTDTGWNSTFADSQTVFSQIVFNSTSNIFLYGQYDNGIKIEYTGAVTNGTRVVRISNCKDITIGFCEFDGNFASNNGQTAGACTLIHIETSSYITIQKCMMHDAADDGAQFRDIHHLYFYDNEIYGLHGCGTDGGCGPCSNGHSDGIELYNVDDSEFNGNYIHNIRSNAAIFFGNWAPDKAGYCSNILMANNIFYNNYNTGFTAYIEQVDGIRLYNNTIWGKAGGNYGGLSLGKYVTGLEMYNNIILSIDYRHIGGSYNSAEHRGDYNCFGVNLGQYGLKPNDIVAKNPGFAGINDAGGPLIANVARDDFQLTGTSPCIDSGTAIAVNTDISGKPRPIGDAFEMGAYEYGEAAPQTPDTTPPTVENVSAGTNFLNITFNEALDTNTATDLNNYAIDNGIKISAATINPQRTIVTLQTSSHTKNNTYTLSVKNVNDEAGNSITETSMTYKFIQDTVGHWRFEESSGTASIDLSEMGNNAIFLNGAQLSGDGFLLLDGHDDAAEISMENMNTNQGSVVVKAMQKTGEDVQYFFGHTVGVWTNNIQLYSSNGMLCIGLGDSHTTLEDIVQLEMNSWYHLVLTWDEGTCKVYIDGTLAGTANYTGLTNLNSIADIGNTGNTSYRVEALDGRIDDAAIYNYALSADEITQLAGEIKDKSLIGHWPFSENSGDTASDISGNNNNGLLLNGPVFTSRGEVSLDGTDDTIQIGADTMNPSRGTISALVAPRSMEGYNYIFGHTTGSWNNVIQIYIDNGYLTLGMGSTHRLATNIQQLEPTKIYHIVLTWDSGNYSIYVDGQSKANGTYTNLNSMANIADIGNNGDPSWRHEAFDGLIDDVRIYNRNLTDTEIAEIAKEFTYGYEILLEMSSNWLDYSEVADIAPPGGDGVVNFLDFLELSKRWKPEQG